MGPAGNEYKEPPWSAKAAGTRMFGLAWFNAAGTVFGLVWLRNARTSVFGLVEKCSYLIVWFG